MLVLFIVGCTVFVGVLLMQPVDETDGQEYLVSPSSCSIEGDNLVLTAEDMYVVGSHPERFPEWVVYSLFKRNSIDI